MASVIISGRLAYAIRRNRSVGSRVVIDESTPCGIRWTTIGFGSQRKGRIELLSHLGWVVLGGTRAFGDNEGA